MTHPHDLLAEHVDGTLGDEGRAVVDAHLATCAACRDELTLARRARSALGALPQPTAPDEVGSRAVAEAAQIGAAEAVPAGTVGSPAEPSPSGAAAVPDHPRWYRWAGAAAGAAAVLLVVALVAPNVANLGGNGATMAGDDERETTEGAFAPASMIEVVPGDLDPDDLAGFAETARSAGAEAPAVEPDDAGTGPEAESTTAERIEDASACLRTAFPAIDGPPIRLISATFQGAPAWIGIFREGPGGPDAPETLQVIAADRTTCTILSTATARL
jgi:hypothetical protein